MKISALTALATTPANEDLFVVVDVSDTSMADSGSTRKITASNLLGGVVLLSGSYSNPTWLTSLAGSKITGNISGLAANVSGTIAIANGGTGQVAKAAAFDALSPTSTLGDISYFSTTNTRLAGNTSTTKQFLSQTGNGSISAAPVWSTLTPTDVGLSNVENTALSTWAGSSNLTTLGTISTGTWSGTAISITKGGTGQVTAAAGFDALSPMTLLGDIIYGGASGTRTRLAGNITATKNFLTQTGNGSISAAPVWNPISSSDVGLGNVENTTLSTWAGSTSITTLGTIATGTWSGTAIAINKGGTGQTTSSAAFDALSPTSTLGDISYYSTTNTRLAGNTTTTRKFLLSLGNGSISAAPSWDTVTKTDVGLSAVENTALSTWAGSTNLTTLGTVSSGTWSGTTISINKGGTGQVTANDALNALLPTQTGLSGRVLQTDGTDTSWVVTSGVPGGSNTQLQFNNSSSFGGAASLTYASNVLTITSQANSDVPLIVTGTASQSGNLVNFKQTTTLLSAITAAGNFTGNAANVTGTVAIANGGTGQTSSSLAFDALSPLTTLGDILYYSTTNTRLAGNTSTTRKFLLSVGNGSISAAPSFDTVTKTDVGLSNVENTALSTWAGSANITTLGTISTGTWQGAVIGSIYGGAGTVSGILKANGSGLVSAATAGVDYASPGSYITSLTGDVTAAGPGAAGATVAFVGGSAASAVNTATVLANAATSANTASAIMRRDASSNVLINEIIEGLTSTATAAGTTTLTVASTPYQRFTGTTTQICKLPDATTLTVGHYYTVLNRSTDAVTLNDNGNNTLTTLSGSTECRAVLTNNSTNTGTWDLQTIPSALSSWAGSTSITTLGTISAGTWSGTTIAINKGGTGQTSANDALNALLPTQTGNNTKFLQTDGTNTSWASATAGAGGSSGQVQYNSGGSLAGAAQVIYATSVVMFTVSAALATDIPLVVKGASAQSVSLQEWRDSADAPMAKIVGAAAGSMQFMLKNNGSGFLGLTVGANNIGLGNGSSDTLVVFTSGTPTVRLGSTSGVFTTGEGGSVTLQAGAYSGISGDGGTTSVLGGAGGVSGNRNGGTVYIAGGAKLGTGVVDGNTVLGYTGSAVRGNVSLFGAGSFGSGVQVISIANATTNPSTNPTGGGILYCDSGALKYRGSSGGVISLGASGTLSATEVASGTTTPLKMNAHYGDITVDSDGATITFDMSVTDKHIVTLGGNRTLAVTNDQDGQTFMLILKQDGTGSRTVTWFANILWSNGSIPTLTTTADKIDVFSFIRLSSSSYLGFTTGLNF
jgi:hypothetical protein